jgi:hypothetical protein
MDDRGAEDCLALVLYFSKLRLYYTMRFVTATLIASMAGSALAQAGTPDAQGRYTLQAEGIKAQFIPYGATLTNLWVKGKPRRPTKLTWLLTLPRQERCTT